MKKLAISLVLTILFFSGCISITKELPAFSTYSLNINDKKVSNKFYDISIKINEPKAINSLNSKAIMYSKDSTSLESYALSRWSDRPSKLIQENIAKFLTKQNSYKLISTSNIKVLSDYVINSEIQEFKHQFVGNKSFAVFSIRVYLINEKTNSVVFKNFSYKKLLKENNAKNFVDTMNYLVSVFAIDLNKYIQSKV
ncbi:MAG: ABC-type transport auxiliary lipoprotein family protein [Halarcobacter sp.]